MATLIWDEAYPDGVDYDNTVWIEWFKTFSQSIKEKLVSVGLTFVSQNIDVTNFTMPALLANSNTYSTIGVQVFKLPIGNGETNFELDSSGEYYNITSNDYDSTPVTLKLYYCMSRYNAETSSTIRGYREQFYMFFGVGDSVESSNNLNINNATYFYQPRGYTTGTGSGYYSRPLSFTNKQCIIHHSENELYISLMGSSNMSGRGSSFANVTSSLLDVVLYRENGDVVIQYFTTFFPNVQSNELKMDSSLYVKYISDYGDVLNYGYGRWNNVQVINSIDNKGRMVYNSVDYKCHSAKNINGVNILPNIIIVSSSYLNNAYIECIIEYKKHKIKKKFKPLKSIYDKSFTVYNNGNHSTNSTFAYSIGE